MASRPAVPATLNTGHTIATNAKSIFLAETDADLVDYKAHSPNAAREGGPVFVETDGIIGPHFYGDDDNARVTSGATADIGTLVTTWPIAAGGVFYYNGTPAKNDYICALCDKTFTTGSGVFGFQVSTSKVLQLIIRTYNGGVVRTINGPTVADNTAYAVGGLFTATTTGVLVVNGTAYTTISGTYDAFDATLGRLSMVGSDHGGAGTTLGASTKMKAALMWYGTTGISQSDLEAWTADPWALFVDSSGGGVPKTTKQTLLGVG